MKQGHALGALAVALVLVELTVSPPSGPVPGAAVLFGAAGAAVLVGLARILAGLGVQRPDDGDD